MVQLNREAYFAVSCALFFGVHVDSKDAHPDLKYNKGNNISETLLLSVWKWNHNLNDFIS